MEARVILCPKKWLDMETEDRADEVDDKSPTLLSTWFRVRIAGGSHGNPLNSRGFFIVRAGSHGLPRDQVLFGHLLIDPIPDQTL